MKRALIGSSALAGVLCIAVAMSPVFATCPGAPVEPISHALGGWFSNCPEPVRTFAYAIGTGAVGDTCTLATCNTAGIQLACTDAAGFNSQGGACDPAAGTPNDGNITIFFDWGGSGTFPGCPNPSQQPNIGRNYLQVIASNGASIFLTVPYSFDFGAYAVDMVQQAPDFPPPPISCDFSAAGLRFRTYDGASLCGNMPIPQPRTECDPGTWGATGGGLVAPICNASSQLPLNRGKLYRKDGACKTAPDPVLSTGGWTNVVIDPVANPQFATTGDFCVPAPKPAAGLCAYFGATGTIGGTETAAMVGNLQVSGDPTAPSARALDVSAKAGGNNVSISFRTEGELGLVGFNVLADAQGGKNRIKVNSALIAPKGVQGGGASYSVQMPKGNFKGAKVLYIESVLTSGTLLSDPASF